MSDDYFDIDERDEMGYERIPGTIHRPLVGEYKADRTIRWGDRIEMTIPAGGLQSVSQDLLNAPLPTARTCQIHFHAELVKIAQPGPPSRLYYSQLEFTIGVGSQMSTVKKRYLYWPMFPQPGGTIPPGEPLDVSFTIPLNNVRGRVTCFGTNVIVAYSLWMTPFAE